MFPTALQLAYLPLPFLVTALYALLVRRASTAYLGRIRFRTLHLLVWFNMLGLPLLFVISGLLFSAESAPLLRQIAGGSGIWSSCIGNAIFGFAYGALSSSPFFWLVREERGKGRS